MKDRLNGYRTKRYWLQILPLLVCMSVVCNILTIRAEVSPTIRFNNLSTQDGLPNNTVSIIVQDSFGFIWIGTQDGLARYEAPETFTMIRMESEYPSNTLASNNIKSLYIDSHHHMWIGTVAGGLSRYQQETGIWETFQHDPQDEGSISNNDILCIEEDSHGRLWIGTEKGLNLFQPETKSFIHFRADAEDPQALQASAVVAIHEDDQGWIWIGTWGGGFYLMHRAAEIEHSTFRQFLPSEDLNSHNVWKIFQDDYGNRWLGTISAGLFLMHLPPNASDHPDKQNWDASYSQFDHDPRTPTTLSNDAVKDLIQDQNGNLWVATSHGLCQIDKEQLKRIATTKSPLEKNEGLSFSTSYNLPNNLYSLSNSNVGSLFEDRHGLIWAGTLSGLSTYSAHGNMFEVWDLSHRPDIGNVERIYANQSDEVWLFTDNGPTKFSLETEEIGNIGAFSGPFVDGKVTEIHRNGDYFYLSSLSNIFRYHIPTGKIKKYPLRGAKPGLGDSFHIRAIYKDKSGRLWIGSDLGLFILNESSGDYQRIGSVNNTEHTLADNSITQIIEDSFGNLWVSTWAGISRLIGERDGKFKFENFDRRTQKMRAGLCSEQVMSMVQVDTLLYLGTSNGICAYNYRTGEFSSVGSNNDKFFVHGLEADREKNLWISTNEGLYCYTAAKQQMRHFEVADGLSDVSFRMGSSFQDETGHLYFGSRWGFTRFQPSTIYPNLVAPSVYLTHARTVNNKSDQINTLLGKSEIELSHRDYLLSISFAAPSYIRPEKNQYKYKLEGFEEEWQRQTGDLKATYTNLAAGDYTFLVIAANNDGVWNEDATSLRIKVRPAFWRTSLFYLGCFLLSAYLLWLSIRYYNKNIIYRNSTLQQLNLDLENEVTNRKKVQAALEERELHMEKLVNERTLELAAKNQEVEFLLEKVKGRNEKLEELVELRTKKLTASNQELTRSNRDLEQFAYVASHDLKEPLRTVGTFVDLFRKKYNDTIDTEGREYLSFVTDGVFRMSNLINSLLTYSRVGRKEVEFSEVDLNVILDNKLEDLSKLIDDRSVDIQIGQLPNILCSREQMGMVFYNLITNAIKFNNKDNPLVRIESPRSSDPHFWKFSVTDNGIGIEAKYQNQIFEIFRRLHNKQDYEGTGIGLALCKKIINRHGGDIWLDSSPGKGTTFYFTIRKDLEQISVVSKELASIDN